MQEASNREILKILSEQAERLKKDGLSQFEPHEKQRAFARACLGGEFSEVWFLAANRAGKSEGGAAVGATLARYGNPNATFAPHPGARVAVRDRATSGWVSALDFPTSRDVIQPKYFNNGMGVGGREPFIPDHEIEEWRVSDQILKLKNGSIVGFKSADSGPAKYQGAAKDWVHFDEVHPYEIYEETTIRVGANRLLFFCTATLLPPDLSGVNPGWIFDRVVPKAGMVNGKSGGGERKDICVITAAIYDNPHIPLVEIERLEAMHPVGSQSRRIRLEGELLPGMAGARAYPAFDRLIHVREIPEINHRRPLCWNWDFNVEPMVTTVGQREGEVFQILQEIWMPEGSIPEMCDSFKQLFPSHGAEIWLHGDATARSRSRQSRMSDYQIILNEMRSYGAPIRLRVPESNPNNSERLRAINRLFRDEYGTNRVAIDPSCVQTIKDYEQVLLESTGKLMKVKNRKDPYFYRTHCSDATDYWLWYEEPVGSNVIGERARLKIPRPNYRRVGMTRLGRR